MFCAMPFPVNTFRASPLPVAGAEVLRSSGQSAQQTNCVVQPLRGKNLLACLCLALALWPAGANAKEPAEPPIAGRPAHFSGGVGTFRVTSRATPTKLQAEEAIHLTVRVTG